MTLNFHSRPKAVKQCNLSATTPSVKGYWTSALVHMAVSLPRRVWAGVE